MKVSMLASAILLSTSMCTAVFAQPAGDAPKAKQPADHQTGDHQPGDRQPGDRGGREGGPRGMGRPLSAEKAKAAWALEAKAAAARYNLNGDQTTALVKAYEDARASVMAKQEEIRKNRAEGGDPGSSMKMVREAETAAREKFTKALTDAKITGDSAAKVNASLGMAMMGMGWDRMVDAIAGMNLPAAKQQQAMNALEDFAAANAKMASNMRDGKGDTKDARPAYDENREKLMTAMKGVLTAEQMSEFEKSTGGGPRGEGRRGGDEARGDHPNTGDKPPKGKK